MAITARRAAARYLLGAAPLALLLGATPAFAQTQDGSTVEEVVVTGTRIRGVEAVGSNVVAVGREEIVETGAATTGDLMRKFPQVVGLGPSSTGSSAQNGAANVTRSVGLNLRGIGVNATLPLWDGRRFPAAGTQGQLVDVSVIPTIALDRLEVVPDGASAIYGSDAITGVVNLMLRKNFDGVEARARYGFGDGYEEYQAGVILGKSWDSGSVMLAYEHAHNSDLIGQDRDWYSGDLIPRGGSEFRNMACNPGTITAGGQTYAIPAGGVTSPGQLTAGTSNRCDTIKDNSIIPEQDRDSFAFHVRQAVSDRVELFAEGFHSQRDFTLRGGGATPGQTLTNQAVPNTNPFFVTPVPGATSVQVSYSFIPVWGFDYNPGSAKSYDVVGGAEFKLGGDWKAELAFSHGESEDLISRTQNINSGAVATALADPNPATALNLFGGANNPATLAAIRNGYFIISAESALKGVEARIDGSLFELPGGTVRMAAGAEYRQEDLATLLISGNALAPVRTASAVERNVKAAYAEVFVPLIGEANALPLAQSLDVSIAGRYEEYAAWGETFNPKFGLTWVPVEGFKVRASWGTSFRAPSPAEYDTVGGGAGLYGDTITVAGTPRFGIGIAGGNANLQPEEATTWSVGFDWQPTWAEGLRVAMTYFDLEYENQILALRGTPGLLTNPLYASYVNLSPTPQQIADLMASGLPINNSINPAAVTFIADGRRQNLGSTVAQGVDFQIDYVWTTGIGDFDAGLTGSVFTEFLTAVAPGAAPADVLGLINNPQQFRFRADLGWRSGPMRALAAVNFVDSYINNTVAPVQKVDDYATVDLHFAYDLGEGADAGWRKDLRLALDVSNAFDSDPPFVNIAGGYDPQSASPIGRVVAVNLTKRW